jgi:hypothetical protein
MLTAQAAGAAAVIGDGDDRSEINNGALRGGKWIVARHDVKFQSAKQSGETGAAAESDDANAARGRNCPANYFCHERARTRAGEFTLAEK